MAQAPRRLPVWVPTFSPSVLPALPPTPALQPEKAAEGAGGTEDGPRQVPLTTVAASGWLHPLCRKLPRGWARPPAPPGTQGVPRLHGPGCVRGRGLQSRLTYPLSLLWAEPRRQRATGLDGAPLWGVPTLGRRWVGPDRVSRHRRAGSWGFSAHHPGEAHVRLRALRVHNQGPRLRPRGCACP